MVSGCERCKYVRGNAYTYLVYLEVLQYNSTAVLVISLRYFSVRLSIFSLAPESFPPRIHSVGEQQQQQQRQRCRQGMRLAQNGRAAATRRNRSNHTASRVCGLRPMSDTG